MIHIGIGWENDDFIHNKLTGVIKKDKVYQDTFKFDRDINGTDFENLILQKIHPYITVEKEIEIQFYNGGNKIYKIEIKSYDT